MCVGNRKLVILFVYTNSKTYKTFQFQFTRFLPKKCDTFCNNYFSKKFSFLKLLSYNATYVIFWSISAEWMRWSIQPLNTKIEKCRGKPVRTWFRFLVYAKHRAIRYIVPLIEKLKLSAEKLMSMISQRILWLKCVFRWQSL